MKKSVVSPYVVGLFVLATLILGAWLLNRNHKATKNEVTSGIVSEKYDSSYLYRHSHIVKETSPDDMNREVFGRNSSTVAIFYASWCPHCVHFVSTYEHIASEIRNRHNLSISFLSINCISYANFCNDQKVGGYPALKLYNFPDDIQSFSSMGMEVAVPSLAKNSIITHILRKSDHVEKITSSKSDLDIHAVPTDPSRSEISEFVERTISSKARSASAELRLQDALSSFNYLLLEEAYLDINTKKINSTVTILKIVVPLLPLDRSIQYAYLLGNLSKLLNSTSSNDSSLADRYHRIVSSHLSKSTKIDWKVCGVSTSKSLRTNDFNAKHINRWNNMSATNVLNTNHLQGYTCGLWMFFHFLTVSASMQTVVQGVPDITTSQIQSTIVLIVKDLFGCMPCRYHFLKAIDSCVYENCGLDDYDYDGGLLWLWRLHNTVTTRIYHEITAAETNGKTADVISSSSDITWPNGKECLLCRSGGLLASSKNAFDSSRLTEMQRRAIVLFLKNAYFDGLRWSFARKVRVVSAVEGNFNSSNSKTSVISGLENPLVLMGYDYEFKSLPVVSSFRVPSHQGLIQASMSNILVLFVLSMFLLYGIIFTAYRILSKRTKST